MQTPCSTSLLEQPCSQVYLAQVQVSAFAAAGLSAQSSGAMSGQPLHSSGLATISSRSMSSGVGDLNPSAYSLSAQRSGGGGAGYGSAQLGASLQQAHSGAASLSLAPSGGSGSFSLQPGGGAGARLQGAGGSGTFSMHTPQMAGAQMGAAHMGGCQMGVAGGSAGSLAQHGSAGGGVNAGGGGLASRSSGALSHYGSNALTQLGSGALPPVRGLYYMRMTSV